MRTTIAKADLPAYLANVMRIATAGGKVAATESFVLQSIFNRLGATEADLTAARQLLARGNEKIYLPKTTNSRMDNLQDMVMVALADGVVTPMESEPIEKIAKVMNYTQADIDLSLRRAETELGKINRRRGQSSRRSEQKPKTERKRSWREEEKISEQKRNPERRRSRRDSPKEKRQVEPPPLPPAAAPPPKPKPVEIEKPPQPEVELPPPSDSAAPQPPAPPKELPQPINKSEALADCIKCRNESEHPETYCFGLPAGPLNPWGCRFSNMPWTTVANWMKLGHYSDEVTFIFDKKSIAEQLSTNLSGILDCPHLNTEYIETAFDSLPKRVTIGERWGYNEVDRDSLDAVTIKTIGYIHGCAVTKTVNADGIIPIGIRDALKIVRKASRKINNPDIYKALKEQLSKL